MHSSQRNFYTEIQYDSAEHPWTSVHARRRINASAQVEGDCGNSVARGSLLLEQTEMQRECVDASEQAYER